MPDIYIIDGAQLDALLRSLQQSPHQEPIRRLLVCVDDGLKVKIGEGAWTAPLGRLRQPQQEPQPDDI
ncbi:hypothetical protein [Catellatospora methionotrophica]|uniref:hypothetical protein n=1 Tax=Catellatospora methionotrophica TaxID=121620 RepID=UPI0033D4F098